MLKSILEIKGVSKLEKNQQSSLVGGVGCPTYPPSQCTGCGGFSFPNGCCLGDAAVWFCLNGGLNNPD